MTDDINAPSHYAEGRDIEPISVIEDWALNFRLANVVKYVARCDRKGSRLKDLRKAKWYLEREISRAEQEAAVEGVLLVGDRVRCVDDGGLHGLDLGATYRVAQVSNGHDYRFVCLAEMPARYWDAARFERVGVSA